MARSTDRGGTPPPRPPPVVGLVGGVAAGKSTVAALFADCGAVVLDADREARRVLEEQDIREALAREFGEAIVPADGPVDRSALAGRVFGKEARPAREFLEHLVHPRVRERLAAALDQSRQAVPPPAMIVLDVPLLVEGPTAAWCDFLVFVDAGEAIRDQRCRDRRHWGAGERALREASQADLGQKRRLASHVIQNDGSLEDLRARVRIVYDAILGSPGSRSPRMGC